MATTQPFREMPAFAAIEPSDLPDAPSTHDRFWDRKNMILTSGMAAATAADFTATQRNLTSRSGGHEYNPVARVFTGSTPGRVVYFAGSGASTVALSYLLHRGGHHKLERVALLVGIGCSTEGATYSFSH